MHKVIHELAFVTVAAFVNQKTIAMLEALPKFSTVAKAVFDSQTTFALFLSVLKLSFVDTVLRSFKKAALAVVEISQPIAFKVGAVRKEKLSSAFALAEFVHFTLVMLPTVKVHLLKLKSHIFRGYSRAIIELIELC